MVKTPEPYLSSTQNLICDTFFVLLFVRNFASTHPKYKSLQTLDLMYSLPL